MGKHKVEFAGQPGLHCKTLMQKKKKKRQSGELLTNVESQDAIKENLGGSSSTIKWGN